MHAQVLVCTFATLEFILSRQYCMSYFKANSRMTRVIHMPPAAGYHALRTYLHLQAPLPVPEKIVKSPPLRKNVSEVQQSPSITTLAHHARQTSSKLTVSKNRDSTSQDCITSNRSTIINKPDQRPVSPDLTQNDPIKDGCYSGSCVPENSLDQTDATVSLS